MKLWLDDVRDPNEHGAIGFTWAKTYAEAIRYLKSGLVTFASLDHDIGACQDCIDHDYHIGDMQTAETTFFNRCPHAESGYNVVCWMEENNVWPIDGTRVHSMNPVGRQRMQQVIDGHYRSTRWIN